MSRDLASSACVIFKEKQSFTAFPIATNITTVTSLANDPSVTTVNVNCQLLFFTLIKINNS